MSWFPGWDTITGTAWWSGFYFWASIVALMLLGIMEVVSHRYSERKDDLVEIQQIAEKKAHDDEIARLHLEASNANKAAEELRAKNLEFEAAISPRVLEQGLTTEALQQFAGLPFVVVSPTDFEPKRTAGQIRYVLQQAKWTRFTGDLRTRPSVFFDGVVVHLWKGRSDMRAIAAADALVSILKENNIEARTGFSLSVLDEQGKRINDIKIDMEPGVLVVVVGPKPLPPSLQMKPESVPVSGAIGMRVFGNILE